MRSPADRTQKQLAELRRDVKRTLKELNKAYPNEAKSEDVLHSHRVRVSVLLNQRKTIKLRYDPHGHREAPYPLRPLSRSEAIGLFVFAIAFPGTVVGLLFLLQWLGAVTGW